MIHDRPPPLGLNQSGPTLVWTKSKKRPEIFELLKGHNVDWPAPDAIFADTKTHIIELRTRLWHGPKPTVRIISDGIGIIESVEEVLHVIRAARLAGSTHELRIEAGL